MTCGTDKSRSVPAQFKVVWGNIILRLLVRAKVIKFASKDFALHYGCKYAKGK